MHIIRSSRNWRTKIAFRNIPIFDIVILQKQSFVKQPNRFRNIEIDSQSIVIIFENEDDFDTINLTAYALWKTKFWHQFLRGSVIPFLSLYDIRKEFSIKVNQEVKDHKEHLKNVQALKLLEQSEKRFNENINLINDMRRVILYRYCKR